MTITPRSTVSAIRLTAAITAVFWCAPSGAWAHGGEAGEHLAVGYYYGHDGSYEAPASPAWAPTLLVDTHPWELSGVSYDLAPVGGLLNGWTSNLPGFEPLAADDQEFDGHGFYSWGDAGYSHGAVDIRLHLDAADPGLQILNPSNLQPLSFPMALGADFHGHLLYFVSAAQAPTMGQVFTATFHLSDANGALAASEPFAVQFAIVPEPASALLILGAWGLLVRARRTR